MLIYILLAASSGLKADFSLGYNMASTGFYAQIILKTILTVTLGFIPLCIGRLMNSSKAAIVSSFLLFAVMNGTIGDFSMRNNSVLLITLFAISLVCAFLIVFNVEKRDIN